MPICWGVKRTIYNQYDSLVRLSQSWLTDQEVHFLVDCKVMDLERHTEAGKLVVTGIHCHQKGEDKAIGCIPAKLLALLRFSGCVKIWD